MSNIKEFVEEIKKEEVKPIETPITETTSVIDKADAVAQRMENANKKAEELLIRQEAIAARMMLSGRSEAGQINRTPEEVQKEKVQEEADKIIKQFYKS